MIHWTADGGVEFITSDDDGNERKIKFRANDDGTFDIVVNPPNRAEKRTTIDPGQ